MKSRSLPRIAIPVACTADWHAMRPLESDGRARLCGACDKPVYDARSMTRGALRRLILKHEGTLPCLRLQRRPDGTIVTKSCFAPVLRAGRVLWLKAGLAAVAFWSAVLAFRSWTLLPAPSVIGSSEAVETDSRKLPFVLKPLAAREAPRRRRIVQKAPAKKVVIEETLGEMSIVED